MCFEKREGILTLLTKENIVSIQEKILRFTQKFYNLKQYSPSAARRIVSHVDFETKLYSIARKKMTRHSTGELKKKRFITELRVFNVKNVRKYKLPRHYNQNVRVFLLQSV